MTTLAGVFSLLGMIAGRTTSIRTGSGIVGCYARPRALTAMGSAALASCAPGRVIAGLGASSPIIVEGWYGRPFGEPVATVREFIAVLRQALSGARVSFAGQALRLVGDATVHALCAVGPPSWVAEYVRALRAAGVALPVVLTPGAAPGAAPGDADGPRATINALAAALDLPARAPGRGRSQL